MLKFKNTSILYLFLLILGSCSKNEKDLNPPSVPDPQIEKAWKVQTFQDLKKEFAFNKAMKEINAAKISMSRASSGNGANLNFTIDSSRIYKIEKKGYTSYSTYIFRDTPSKNFYENLLIEIDSTKEITAALLKFNVNTTATHEREISSIERTPILNAASLFNRIPIYEDDPCTTVAIFSVKTCGCAGHHWPGDPRCTCDNDPPEVMETIYTTCDQGGSGATTDDVGTQLYVASDDQNAGYYQTYSYAVTDPYNAVMLRRKSLKLSSPDGIGLSNYTWLGDQSEEFQGSIYDYLEGTVNFDGLFSDADYYPQSSISRITPVIQLKKDGNLITPFPTFQYPPDSNYSIQYPKLTEYLKNKMPLIADMPEITGPLLEITNLSLEDIKNDLKWGQGPTIEIINLDDYFPTITDYKTAGLYDHNNYPNTVFLDEDYVNYLENDVHDQSMEDGLLFYLGVVLLHEYTHYGVASNGVPFPGEEGTEFEVRAYGEDLEPGSALDLILTKYYGY